MQKLITLNYKTDNQHNLRSWNDALINIPGLKREGKKKKLIYVFYQKMPRNLLKTLTILKQYYKFHFSFADSETCVLHL